MRSKRSRAGDRPQQHRRGPGRGKGSGFEPADAGGKGAEVWHLQSGVLTRLHTHFDRDLALADLGLKE